VGKIVVIFSCLKSLGDFQLTAEIVKKCVTKNTSVYELEGNDISLIKPLAIAFSGENGEAKSDIYYTNTSRLGKNFICGSAELHNRLSLIESLGLNRKEISVYSDVDLILSSYGKWGTDSFKRFIGNFSFVIWDGNIEVLFGVVDHLGIYSLYYRFIKSGYLFFSNRLKIIARPEKPTIDNDYITAYLLNCYQLPGKTIFREISAVPPGCFITVKGDSIRANKYWEPSINVGFKNNESTIRPDIQLKSLLFKSVECRTSMHIKNGILLSGGLDSSAIGCIANYFLKQKGSDLAAFSKVLSPELGADFHDEKKYILSVADQEKLSVSFATDVDFTNRELLHEYFAAQYSFPLNPFAFLSRPLFQMVSADRCATLFTGFGGDETASAEGLTSLPYLLNNLSLPDFFKNISALSKRYNIPIFKIIKGFVIKPLLPVPLVKLYRKSQGHNIVKALSNAFIQNEILQSFLDRDLLADENGYTSDNFLDPRKEMLNRVISTYFRPFFDFDEYLSAVYNIKQVHPFLDIRIIEFMLSIHPREYLLKGLTRSIFRRSVKGVIPEDIRWRKDKIPFNIGVPFSRCIVEGRDVVEETLLNKDSSVWEIVNRELLLAKFYWLEQRIDMRNANEYNSLALEIGRCVNVAAFYQWQGV
jgi:asparagine synthase (glutamine-hydrolysing)